KALFSSSIGAGHTSFLKEKLMSNDSNVLKIETLSRNFSDSGVFAVYGVTERGHQGKFVKDLTNILKQLKPTEEEFIGARQQYKAEILSLLDSQTNLVEYLGNQFVTTGTATSFEDVNRLIDQITLKDV